VENVVGTNIQHRPTGAYRNLQSADLLPKSDECKQSTLTTALVSRVNHKQTHQVV